MNTSYVKYVREDILNWLEVIRWKQEGWGRFKYNAEMERDYGLIPSAQAILIMEMLNALGAITEEQRKEAIEFLQSAQDPKDGCFKDPLVKEGDRVVNATHSWEDIWGQMGVAAEALRALDAKPLYPLPQASFADFRTVNVREWLLSLNWQNPWHVGERFSRAVKAYIRNMENQSGFNSETDPKLKELFETYEKEIHDPITGMPLKKGCTDPSVAMAGVFKVISGYLAAGRKLPYAEKAIDFTLKLQHEDGEFGFRKNMCINWDALWVLRELDKQLKGQYRHNDIVKSGNLMAKCLLEVYRKPDGGFAFCGDHCWPVHHSIKISEPFPISDTSGTKMSLNCLAYADEWNGALSNNITE